MMNPPNAEVEMSRDLEAVNNFTDYILWEDLPWRTKNSGRCFANKKYGILGASRPFSVNEKRVSSQEVKGFPVLFQVRESYQSCNRDKNMYFGIFHPDTPDSPAWPNEAPLLKWTEPQITCCSSLPKVEVTVDGGRRIGYGQMGDRVFTKFSIFDAMGDLLYTLRTSRCSQYKVFIYEGKGKVPAGFIRKIWSKCWEDSCQCHNLTSGSFPATSNSAERLLLLRELVMHGRRFQELNEMAMASGNLAGASGAIMRGKARCLQDLSERFGQSAGKTLVSVTI